MKKFLVAVLTTLALQSTIAAVVIAPRPIVISRPAPVVARPVTPVVAPKVVKPVTPAVTEPVRVTPTPVIIPQYVNTNALCTDTKRKNNQC